MLLFESLTVLTAQVQKGYNMLGHPQCFHTCQLSSCWLIKTKVFLFKHANPMRVKLVKICTWTCQNYIKFLI